MVRAFEKIRVNKYTTIQVSSVLLPGLLLLIEIGYATVPRSKRTNLWEVFTHVSDRSEGIKGGVIILIAVLAVLFAYAVGFLARRLSLFVVDSSQRILDKIPFAGFFATPNDKDVRKMFTHFYPSNREKAWFVEHPGVFRSSGTSTKQHDQVAEAAEESVPDIAPEWFGYFKTFLQGADERFSIDYAEFEVNTMASLIAPTAGGALVALDLASPSAGVLWSFGTGCSIVLVMVLSIIRMRRDERMEAARKFLLANVVPTWPVEETAEV